MEWTPSQWVIIPLLFVTCFVVAAGLIGLLFGPFMLMGLDLMRASARRLRAGRG